MRDQTLVDLIRPAPLDSSTRSAVGRLRNRIDGDLTLVYGSADLDERKLRDLTVLAERRRRFLVTRSDAEDDYQQAGAMFLEVRPAGDRRPVACTDVPPPVASDATSSEADQLYSQLSLACDRLKKADPVSSLGPIPDGRLGQAVAEASSLRDRILAGQAEAGRIQGDIDALEKAAAETPTSGLDDLIKKVAGLLDQAGPLAKVAGLDRATSRLGQVLAGELGGAPAPGADSGAADTRRVEALLKLFRATAGAADGFAAEPRVQRVNSLLLGIAALRHEQRMAQLGVDRDADQLRIGEAQVSACLGQLAALAEARLLTGGGIPAERAFADLRRTGSVAAKGRAGAALASYARAWTEGETPYQVLVFRAIQVDRAFAVKQAAGTADDYQAVLEPALAELEAYGAGGIRPEVLAQLLGDLGIITAISVK